MEREDKRQCEMGREVIQCRRLFLNSMEQVEQQGPSFAEVVPQRKPCFPLP